MAGDFFSKLISNLWIICRHARVGICNPRFISILYWRIGFDENEASWTTYSSSKHDCLILGENWDSSCRIGFRLQRLPLPPTSPPFFWWRQMYCNITLPFVRAWYRFMNGSRLGLTFFLLKLRMLKHQPSNKRHIESKVLQWCTCDFQASGVRLLDAALLQVLGVLWGSRDLWQKQVCENSICGKKKKVASLQTSF